MDIFLINIWYGMTIIIFVIIKECDEVEEKVIMV